MIGATDPKTGKESACQSITPDASSVRGDAPMGSSRWCQPLMSDIEWALDGVVPLGRGGEWVLGHPSRGIFQRKVVAVILRLEPLLLHEERAR